MLSAKIFTSAVLLIGLAIAAPSPSEKQIARANLDARACVINGEDCHGERTCIAGGISYKYANVSYCAKLAATDGSFIAWCPNGHWDNGVYHDIYTSAGCISAFMLSAVTPAKRYLRDGQAGLHIAADVWIWLVLTTEGRFG